MSPSTIDRRTTMVRNPPAMARINPAVYQISEYKHRLSYGVWVFAGLSAVLVAMNAPLSNIVPMVMVTLALAALYWRWSLAGMRIRDARVPGLHEPLQDATDLAWLAWARDFEPVIDQLLRRRRPHGDYRLGDFKAAYALFAHFRVDLPKRPPWWGDTEACFAAQERRRDAMRSTVETQK